MKNVKPEVDVEADGEGGGWGDGWTGEDGADEDGSTNMDINRWEGGITIDAAAEEVPVNEPEFDGGTEIVRTDEEAIDVAYSNVGGG